jgi:hypothetical protein
MTRRLIGGSAIVGACALVLGVAASTPARADGVSFGDRNFHVRLNWGRPVGDPYCDPYARDYVVVRDRYYDRDRHDRDYRDRDRHDWDRHDRDRGHWDRDHRR